MFPSLKLLAEKRDRKVWTVTGPRPRSCVSAEKRPSHHRAPPESLPWAPGVTARTDRQRGPPGALSGQVRIRVAGPWRAHYVHTAWRAAPLSDTLLHGVHGHVVVIAAHGQVRLQGESGERVSRGVALGDAPLHPRGRCRTDGTLSWAFSRAPTHPPAPEPTSYPVPEPLPGLPPRDGYGD